MKKKSKLSTLLNETHHVKIEIAEVLGRTKDSTTILDTDGQTRFVRKDAQIGETVHYIIGHCEVNYVDNSDM